MFETYRLLGEDREAQLLREAARLQRAALAARNAKWPLIGTPMSTVGAIAAVIALMALVIRGTLG